MTRNTDQSVNMTGTVMVAALVGVAAGILFAPRTGRETRAKIKQKLHRAKQQSIESVEEVTEAVGDAVAEARSQVEDAATEVQARQSPRHTNNGL